jgi:23S rRNA-/tRNA-specific pseudouridylate synthase
MKMELLSSASVINNFECEDCDLKFPSRNKLFTHIRDMHEKVNNTDNSFLDLNRFSPLNIISIDDSILIAGEDYSSYRVVIKPQGISTMGKAVNGQISLQRRDEMLLPDAVQNNISYKKAIPCHRLDNSTGGLVICSVTRHAEVCIKMCFKQKLIHKRYRAIVPGKLEPKEGSIATPVGDKESLTKYSVVDYSRSSRYGWISTVDLWPITGRRHQLRKHLLSVGHPILGDKRYSHAHSSPERIGGKELMFLWSLEVLFPCPINTNSEEENTMIRNKNFIKLSKVDTVNSENHEISVDCRKQISVKDDVSEDDDEDCNDNCDIQMREEMFAIETRKQIRVVINEPLFYETFRECHRDEWNRLCSDDDDV